MKTMNRRQQELRRKRGNLLTCPKCKKQGIITRQLIACECGHAWTVQDTLLDDLRAAFPERANEYEDDKPKPTTEKCEACDGSGELECTGCEGSGSEECPHCSQDMDCEECDGEGMVDCNECDGTGNVTPASGATPCD